MTAHPEVENASHGPEEQLNRSYALARPLVEIPGEAWIRDSFRSQFGFAYARAV
jgi:hypothetical protein